MKLYPALCLLFGMSPAFAHSSEAAQVKAQIIKAYAHQTLAISKKDVEGYLATLTPDYKEVLRIRGQHMTYNRDFISEQVFQVYRQTISQTRTTKIGMFTYANGRATAAVTQHINAKFRNPSSGQIVGFTTDAAAQDIWVKSGKEWKLQQHTVTSSDSKSRVLSKGKKDENEDRFVEPAKDPPQPDKATSGGGLN